MARGKAVRPGAMAEASLVNRYVESLRAKTASRRSTAQLRERLANLERAAVESLSPVQLMERHQRMLEIKAQLASQDDELEEQVVGMLRDWAEYKGFSYSTLRAVGIPAAVLERAGISRGDKP